MSKSSKIILWIVVLIAIGLIAWCYFGTSSSVAAPVSAPLTEQNHQAAQNQQLAEASDTAVSGLTTSPSDNSNAALDSDMSVISGQSAAMNTDSQAASQPAQ